MKSRKLALCVCVSAMAIFAQSSVSLTVSGNAALTGGNAYSLNGIGVLGSFGQAIFSGGGTINPSVLAGTPGPITGTFSLIYPTGDVMYGAVSIPAAYIVPAVGNPTFATGTITILGGTGQFAGARGTFPNATGSGTGTGVTTSTFQVSATGTLSVGDRILSQFVFGGGWYSAIYCSNYSTSTQGFTINFTADAGTPLTVPSMGGSSVPVTLGVGGALKLEAPNSGTLQQGYASMTLPAGVSCYGVFRQSVSGIPDQEAVVELSNAASTYGTFIFDDTSYITGVALVNPSSTANVVTITATGIQGNALGTGTVSLPAKSKTAIALKSIPGLASLAGNRGTVTFTVAAGNVTVLGLRFNGSAFTSIPATDR